jgi:hypothetical protein
MYNLCVASMASSRAALKGKDGSARLAACDADAHVVLTGMRQPQQQEFN